MLARCVVPNPKGDLKPGLFVDGEIVTGEVDAAVAVKATALQTHEGKTVVFAADKAGGFEPREIETGARDDEWVEITRGLQAGENYVAKNSFIPKAELGKGEAEHDH
jgi:cobalt-zinc-cadmium efflux system membrane fusion protein